MKINQYRNEIEQLLNFNNDVLKFSQYEEPPLLIEDDKYTTEDFYNSMEEKLESLKSMGMKEQDINEKVYFALSLHLEISIKRIKKGRKNYKPKLNFIRINYEEEFLFAMRITKIIDNRFGVETPKVGVIVIMHGRATASSMVEWPIV